MARQAVLRDDARMKQATLAAAADQGAEFERFRRPTRRDVFLQTMDTIVPWAELFEVIEPHYPKAGKGRPPIGLERMLRMYFVQHWFNLADAACEEALCWTARRCAASWASTWDASGCPMATTLAEVPTPPGGRQAQAGRGPVRARSARYCRPMGMKVGTGTIVDATIISRAEFDEERPDKRARSRRCTRPRRASSGSSA